jgi:hypothetical protein
MPILPAARRALVASVWFVLALVAVTVGGAPYERPAYAQARTRSRPPPNKKPRDQRSKESEKEKEKELEAEKEKESAAAAAAAEEEKKRKTEEAEKKAEPETKPAEGSESKELDPEKEEPPKAVYISADIGITRADLAAILDDTSFDRTGAFGLLYGLGAGVRLKETRIGLRWRIYDTTEFTLWTIGASFGVGLPLRPLSPVVSVHAGYVFDQRIQAGVMRRSLPEGVVLAPDVDVKGLLAGLDVTASYWFTNFIRLGPFIGADLMLLHRSQATYPRSIFGTDAEIEAKPLYNESGSGLGLNVNIGLRGAFDIGFKQAPSAP